jgi:hypothetical protein
VSTRESAGNIIEVQNSPHANHLTPSRLGARNKLLIYFLHSATRALRWLV